MFSSAKQNKLPLAQDQLLLTPAHKLSKQIRDGSVSAAHLCQVYIDRIKQVNPTINAMAQDRFLEALAEAKHIDELLKDFRNKPESGFSADQLEMLRSPLIGIPVSVKECIKIKAMKNTCGIHKRRDAVADEDSVVVKNARHFGLIPICTTNIPEGTFYWADCHNIVYGKTLNPYDLSRVPGGSSGGEAALISSAGSLLGIGSDLGGSLRMPPHYCGINSHKPSPFLISSVGNFPDIKEFRLRLFTLGPISRYASDLRHFMRVLMSDKENSKKDTYFRYQPANIGQLRDEVASKLETKDGVDFSQVKLFYFNFNSASKLKGKQSVHVNEEFMECQEEILNHFRSKFNCQTEHINLDKYFEETLKLWEAMFMGGGTVDREKEFDPNEIKQLLGIENFPLELMKIPLGLSKHTKELLLFCADIITLPQDQVKALAICEKFELMAQEWKKQIEEILGDNGVLIAPTLPTVALKHHISIMRSPDVRFPALFNCLQLPATHVHLRQDKKHKMPFGFSLAAKSYQDHLTITLAEEIELAFGGWRQPTTETTSATSQETSKLPVAGAGDVPASSETNSQQVAEPVQAS